MEVRVGPVSAGSVRLWVAYARTVLGQALAASRERPASLTPDVVESFESFLDQWDDLAATGAEFVWEADLDTELIEHLAHVWFTLAAQLADQAEQRGFPLAPPEGDEFYQALVAGLLDGLAHEGRSLQEFAEQLKDAWPGLKEP